MQGRRMKVPADYRYRCNNARRPRPDVLVQDGWESVRSRSCEEGVTSREPRMVEIPDPMTKDCRYSADGYAATDPGCTGCRHGCVS